MKIQLIKRFVVTLALCWLLFNNAVFSQEKKDSANVFNMSLEQLLDMEVTTVSKSAEKQSDAPGIISVLSKDEIKRFGGATLAGILERIPGLIGTTAYMSDRTILSARGEQISSTSNHVLLLINGRPVREMLESGINSDIYETFPVNIIERIEVIKGPGSVLYGTNAFSGVINIITQKAEQTRVTVSGLAGTTGTYGMNGDIKIKTGDLSIVVAGRYLKKPDWVLDYSRLSGTDTITQSVTIPNDGSGGYMDINYKNISIMTSYNEWKTTAFASRATGNVYWKKSFSNLGYDFEISPKWHSSINIGYTLSKLDVDSTPKIHRNSHELLGEWTNFIRMTEKVKLIFGGVFSNIKGKEYNLNTGSKVYSSDGDRIAYSGYAQVNYLLLKNLNIIGGVQLNKMENIDMDFVPRIGLIYHATERINVKTIYSKAYRAPSINENVLYTPPLLVGNPDLKPEKVGNIDVSASYQGEQMQVGVNYFHSKLSNIIIQNRNFTPGIYDNVGEVTIQGVEFEAKYYINRSLFISGSMLYQASEDSAGNENVSPIANISAKGGISYMSDKGISVGLFDIYQGELDDKYKSSMNESPEKAFNRIYLHLDFDVNKLFAMNMKQKFNVYIHADNLFDKKVYLPLWGTAGQRSCPYDLGRIIYAGISISF